MITQNESVLAVVGGGRWGQVILSILANIPVSFDRVVIVTRFNETEITDKLAVWNKTSSVCFSLVNSVDDLIKKYDVNAAIIVNSPRQHFETALRLINRGVHVLIEKPIVLSAEHMTLLLEKARQNEVCIFPGLCYRFASYIDNFAELIAAKGMPSSFVVKWSDMANEVRYGKLKRKDTTIDVAQDVMPHIWTILSKIFRHPIAEIQTCHSEDITNDYADFKVSINNMTGQVILNRNASCRERFVNVDFGNDKFLKIDFTTEPGMIFSESDSFIADESWHKKLSPLIQQLNSFFSSLQNGCKKDEANACLNSVIFSESASDFLHSMIPE